jgi:hypothetical protein
MVLAEDLAGLRLKLGIGLGPGSRWLGTHLDLPALCQVAAAARAVGNLRERCLTPRPRPSRAASPASTTSVQRRRQGGSAAGPAAGLLGTPDPPEGGRRGRPGRLTNPALPGIAATDASHTMSGDTIRAAWQRGGEGR